MSEVLLSVALVTRNRPDSLQRTLSSLRKQDVQPYEIVVSDDSETGLAQETKRVALAYDCRYVEGPKRGLYANRNHAAKICQGSHIRTMDDDHEFPINHFRECIGAVSREPGTIWIIGEHYPGTDAKNIAPICPGQLQPGGFSNTPPNPNRCWAISDGASIYPKSIFEQGQKFDEQFKFGAAFLEFGSRLHWLGYQIKQLSSTYVLHHYDALNRSFLDEQTNMASTFFAMMCHSFLYQSSFRNRTITCLQGIKWAFSKPRVAVTSICAGFQAYKTHERLLRSNLSKT